MSGIKSTLWELDPHTIAKHEILRRYLQAWYPILSSGYKKIVYIDGFAGPGEYLGGEKGSPVIAIQTAIEHILNLKSEVNFIFIEKDKDRANYLEGILKCVSIPDNFNYEVNCDKFDVVLNRKLDELSVLKDRTPHFAFIDPFGYKDIPFSIIKRIMSFRSCEVLITFMSGFVNRFINEAQFEEDMDVLFGYSDWKSDISCNEYKKSEKAVVGSYLKRLSTVATYVRSFEMKNKFNQPIYHLVFATNSYDGLSKMKDSMWSTDPSGQFSFSDTTDPNQSLLFVQEEDRNDIKRLIVNKFAGKDVDVEGVERFVVIETSYREAHFKKILSEMEKANPPELEVIDPKAGRRKGTYRDQTMVIRFSPRPSQSSQIRDRAQPKYQNKDLSSFFNK